MLFASIQPRCGTGTQDNHRPARHTAHLRSAREVAMVQHILIAHDLSPEADLALRRAAQLARQTGARLSLLHVLAEHGDEIGRASCRERVWSAVTGGCCEKRGYVA